MAGLTESPVDFSFYAIFSPKNPKDSQEVWAFVGRGKLTTLN